MPPERVHDEVTIYHNPACGTSRNVLGLIRNSGVEPRVRFVTVMLDGDVGGRAAADVVITKLARHWWVRLSELLEGEQPDTASVATLNGLLRRA